MKINIQKVNNMTVALTDENTILNNELHLLKVENIRLLNLNKTFPIFNHSTYKSNLTPLNMQKWSAQAPFVYNGTECKDCDYRPETRDDKGNLYLGQWNAQS